MKKNQPQIGYTIREAAIIRGVHPDTVRRQIRKNQITAHSIRGFIYLIPPSQIHKIKRHKGGRPKKPT